MKDSTVTLACGFIFLLVGNLIEPPKSLEFFDMAFFSILTSCICRAIERNGKER